MPKRPNVIALLSFVVLLNSILRLDSRYHLTLIHPMGLVSLILPFSMSIGLFFRKTWAWYFAVILTFFKIFTNVLSLVYSLPNILFSPLFLLAFSVMVFFMLFNDKVYAFFQFHETLYKERKKQALKYGFIFLLIMIPYVWINLAISK